MRTFNLVKSLTRVINNRKGLFILCLSLVVFGVNEVLGGGSNTYYAKATAAIASSSTGHGKVYVDTDKSATPNYSDSAEREGEKEVSWDKGGSDPKNANVEFFFWAKANDGYSFSGWSESLEASHGTGNNNAQSYTINSTSDKKNSPISKTWYATFAAKTYTINLYLNDGASDKSTISVTYNQQIPASVTVPTREGYCFNGYFDNATTGQGTKYYNSDGSRVYTTTWTTDGGKDLYAQWLTKYDFTISCSSKNIKVDETADITFVHADNPDNIDCNITEVIPSSTIRNGNKVIEYDEVNHKIIARNAGTAKITFSQKEDTKEVYAGSQSFDITVSKHVPTFTWSNTALYHNQTYNDFFTTTGTNALTVKSSDADVAYLVDGSNAQKRNLKTLTKAGSTTLTVTQAENYYWAEHTESKTITPGYASNHVPFKINQSLYNTLKGGSSGDQSWEDNSVKVGSSSATIEAAKFNDKYIILGPFVGIPDKLSLSYSCSLASTGWDYRVYESSNGSNWSQLFRDEERSGSKSNIQLSPETRYIQLFWSGNYAGYFKDITITELKTFSAEPASLDFGTQEIRKTCDAKTFKFNYANVGHKVTLTPSDNHFSVPDSPITTIGGEKEGTIEIKVFYNTDEVHTASNAKVTIADELGNSTTVDLSGKTILRSNAITWNPNTTDKKNHGEVVTMEATSNNTDYTNYPITFTSSNTDYATIDGNKVTFLAAGAGKQVTITANQAESDLYQVASLQKTFTIKSAQSLTYNNGQVNVSINEDHETIDVSTLKIAQTGDGDITYAIKSGEGGVLNETTFYGTVANEVVITATAANTANYEAVSKDFIIHVNKRTPTFTWKTFEHIYAGEILENVASTSYNGNPVDLQLTYTNVSGSFVVEGNTLHISKQFTEEHDAIVGVTTTETDYYAQASEEHTYRLESKKLPKFYLNGVEMSTEAENNLTLKIGETANVSFDQTEESQFTYTNNAQFVTYAHDATQHTGVFTATASGDEGFQFHQAGTTTVFDRTCQMHIWVKKHTNTLSSPIHDNDVWMVDSIYAGDMYSIVDDGYTGQAQEDVVVESSDEAVIRHMQDGSWKAVGEGTATITMRQLNNAYWTGDTITRVIKVQKHTPVITWNIENAQYPWSSVITEPVTSSNTDIPFTITSNNKSVADYVDGRIVVYNTTGSVTFTLTQEGNYKWNAATTNLTKSFSTFQPANHVPFTLNNNNNTNFYSTHSGTYTWSNGYKIGNGGINTFNKNTSSVTIRFTGVPDKLSFTKTLSKVGLSLPGDGDCNCYVYESADGSSWSQCWKDVERIETKNVSNIQLQPTTRYLKFEYNNSCVYCTYSNINVTERSSIEPVANSLDFGTGYNGNTAAKRSVDVNWYSVMPCTVTISGADASQFYVGDDSKTIASSLDNSGIVTLNVFYTHEENKSHTATLTITSADTPAKTAEIQLTGMTERAPQEIIWREDITPLPHNGGVYEGAALASSGGEVVLTSDDESIVKVVGNGLQPVGVGKTMVHAYQAGDDIKWQPINVEKEIEVTSLSVQHLIWNDQLNNIKRTDGQTVNITLTAQSDAIALDPSLVVTYELDDDAKAFASVIDNQLTITGWGSGYITAKQVGNANYVPAQQTKRLVSRNPDVDCRALAAEDANEYTLHTIASKEINITNGEPATIEFDAKMDLTAIGEGLHLDEWYNGSWHEFMYIDWDVMAKNLGNYAHYGPYNLNRKTTKVRFYTNTGATMRRYFKNVEVTLARYLEVAQNDMSFAGVDKGAFLDQTFYINYSNLRGTLDVELQNASSNLQVITTTVGNDCGEIGQMVPIKIRCTGNVCGTENNVIVLSNKGQKLEVPVSATVVPPSQNITWNPQTTILTTDVVALNATCTSNLPISYSSNNTDVATVQQDGSGVWSMTIIRDGTVTITASQAGSADWSPAPDKNVVFNISKATPVVTTWATPSEVTKWSALSTSTLTGGEASVAGSFSWQDGTIQVERGNSGYTMVFTPTNTNWYNTVANTIVVPVAKDPQAITWNYTPQPIYCNAELYFDAVASSGLKVRYESSDPTVAYVNDNRLVIIKGGNVTITAVQDGDDTWAYTSLSKNLEILRWTPNIVIKPVANSMLIGQHLDNATLNGGRAELDGKQVDGSFSWQDGSVETIDVAGKATRVVVFTPSNPNHYNSATCEVEVDVKKYAPTVTHTLSATDITYGQALNASSLNGTLTAMDEVKYPHEEVAGAYDWKESTKQLPAGKHTEIVRFTPSNLDWYDVVDIEIPVVVNKAHATTATAVVNMLYGQSLEEVLPINTTADAVSGIIDGTITWDASVDVEAIPAQGEYDYPIHLAVTNPNYVAEMIDGICHVVVEKGFVFDGHGGSSDWNANGNWVDGSQPTGMEDKVIVIADATIINSEINVGAITIKQGVDVIIEEDGVLNVGDYDCVSRKQYGNMVVKNGGQLNLNTGEVQVNNFTLEASLGGVKDAERVSARSGSVTNAEQLTVNGNAYFDIALDASGECTQGWYDLTVPFPVNALTGVQRFENGVLRTNLKNEVNYAIMSYHEDVRAQGKYGWSKYRGIMQPGQCYTITIDDYHNVYRFVKTASGSLNVSNTVQVTATAGEGGDENKGWNCVGNGTCHHANIAIEGINKVQIYDHATNSYSPIDYTDKTFAVGSAFFLQTPQDESVIYSTSIAGGMLYAPQRNTRPTGEFLVALSSIKSQNVKDKLYLSAADDAINTYEIGHDLSKFEVSSTIAQMWCTAYGMQLCDVELPWVGETATFPIEMFAPKAGEYILSVQQTNKDEQLFLLYNGALVTELTANDIILQLNKGINKNYELQIVNTSSIATDMEDNNLSKGATTRKVIVNNKLYLFRENKVFDAVGKRIK